MFSWLKKRKVPTTPDSRDVLLNEGLHLAMEWGESWLKPIQQRLATRHPALTKDELDEINAICQAAMRFGHDAVYDLALKSGKNTRPEDFEPVMKSKYSWVNSSNLSHLFSQGMYYAWKDTGLA